MRCRATDACQLQNLSRASPSTLLPPDIALEDLSLKRPFPWSANQPGPYGIHQHISAFFFGAFPRTNAMMKATALPPPTAIANRFGKHRFPVLNPPIERCGAIARPSEQVQMVGHQDIGPYFPMRGGLPNLDQRCMDLRICQPRRTACRASTKENQITRNLLVV
jgi:hypothetical protein